MIISLLIFLIPYNLIGEEFGSVILLVIGSVFVLKNIRKIKVNKSYLAVMIGLSTIGAISLLFTQNISKSLSGLTIYLNFIVFYFVFSICKDKEEKVIKSIVYTISIIVIFSIAYQGVVYKRRIDGNFGYANTYALILLIALYLNEIIKENKLWSYIQIVLITGIIFTGSRNTLFYFILFLAYVSYKELKDKKTLSSFVNFIIALICYSSIQYLGFGMLFVLPILMYTVYIFIKGKRKRTKHILFGVISIIGIALAFFSNTNFAKRILNISINSGVLQERFVYFHDVIPEILKKPLGHGINTFEYKEYLYQSAFYDVKYVHNSILQVGFDIGILGVILFVLVAVLGLYLIVKHSSKNKYIYILCYCTIFLHSLLDFDFSYASVFIVISMIVAFNTNNKEKEISSNLIKIPMVIIGILAVYLFGINSLYQLSNTFVKYSNYNGAINMLNLNKRLIVKDPDVYSRMAECYNLKFQKNNDKLALKSCIDALKKAEVINPYDPRITGNLAFAYEKLGNTNLSMDYYEKFLNTEKYYYKVYQLYYKVLKNQYDNTKEDIYKEKIDSLKKRYSNSYNSLNPKSKYMNDQLPMYFEQIINLK